MMATIYCMRCGAPLSETARFCTECGSPTLLGIRLADERRAAAAERVAAEDREAASHERDEEAASAQHRAAEETQDAEATVAFTPQQSDAAATGGSAPEVEPAATPAPRHESAPRHGAPAAAAADVAAEDAPKTQRHAKGGAREVAATFNRILAKDDESARRTKLWGLAAAALAFVVVLGAGFASGLLGPRKIDITQVPEVTAEGEDEGASDTQASLDVAERLTLSEYSWTELSDIAKAMSEAGSREAAFDIARRYHLVDYEGKLTQDVKDVTIIGVGTMHMRLVGVWHDDLADGGKAGLSFLSDDLMFTHHMKDVDDNLGGWEGSELRSWLNVNVCNSLSDELRTRIVAVDKRTNNVGHTVEVASVTSTLDKLWIPSLVEVTGPIAWRWDSDPENSELYNAVMNAEGTQYQYFADAGISQDYGNEVLVRKGENGALPYWLRSSSCSKDQHYRTVNTYGNPVNWAAATDELGVCVGFCL